MKTQTILGIIAAVFIFLGFGMIHATPLISIIGSIMIGIGCLYLIYRIYISIKNSD